MNPEETKREVLRLIQLKKQVQEDSVLKNMKFSAVSELFLFCRAKIAMLIGGNRSGKSVDLSADVSIRQTGVIPDSLLDRYPVENIQKGEAWVSALSFSTSYGITEKKIKKILPKRFIVGENKEHRIVFLKDEAQIGFKSAEQGREKYQGESKKYVSHDEEPPQDVYDESYARTIDCSGIVRVGFTPLKGLTWAYSTIYKKAARYISSRNIHGIVEDIGIVHTPEEIKLLKEREVVIIENTSEDADPDIEVFQMTIYDNVHLPDIEIHKAEKKYKDDPLQYKARILGKFGNMIGRNVFAQRTVDKIQKECPRTFLRGDIHNGQFKLNPKGNLIIFKDLKEIDRHAFVVAGDIAEGLEEGDFNCAQVLSHKTGEQWAVWHGKCNPEDFADILVILAKFFRNAWLAPERNFHGMGVIRRIKDVHKYPFLYRSFDEAKEAIKGEKGETRFGWLTDAKSKPIMIQDLSADLTSGAIKVNDIQTAEELSTYVYNKDGKTEAQGACHDDRVTALAIANQVRKRKAPVIFIPENSSFNERRDPVTGY